MTNSLLWKTAMLSMDKSTISMAIFHSYVKLPEDNRAMDRDSNDEIMDLGVFPLPSGNLTLCD